MNLNPRLALVLTFLAVLFLPSVSPASCLKLFQEKVEGKTFWKRQGEYEKLQQLVLEAQAQGAVSHDKYLTPGFLRKMWHRNSVGYLNLKTFFRYLLLADDQNLLCPDGKAMKYTSFKYNFESIMNQVRLGELKREFALAKDAYAKKKGTFKDYLQFYNSHLQNWDKENDSIKKGLISSEEKILIQTIQESPDFFLDRPTLENLAQLETSLTNVSSVINIRIHALPLVRGTEDYIKLISSSLQSPSEAYKKQLNQFALDHLDSLLALEHPLAIADLTKLDGHLQTVNYSIKLREQILSSGRFHSPQDYLELMRAGVNNPTEIFTKELKKLAIKNRDFFFKATPAPTIVQVRDLLSHVTTIDDSLAIRKAAFDLGLVKTTGDFVRLLKVETKNPHPSYTSRLNEMVYFNILPQLEGELSLAAVRELEAFLKGQLPADQNRMDLLTLVEKKKQELQKRDEVGALELITQNIKRALSAPEGIACRKDEEQRLGLYLALGPLDRAPVEERTRLAADQTGKRHPCPACLEDWPAEKIRNCPSCLKSQCQDCFTQGLKVQIKDENFPVTCDYCKKEQFILPADVAAAGEEAKWPVLEKRSLVAYHQALYPGAKNCTTPDCQNIILEQACRADNHVCCSICQQQHCFACGDNHPLKTCQEHLLEKKGDQAFQKLLAKGEIRLCYNCKAPIQKSIGCNRIECRGCKKNNYWDPEQKVLLPWKGYEFHNANGETWKGVQKK